MYTFGGVGRPYFTSKVNWKVPELAHHFEKFYC